MPLRHTDEDVRRPSALCSGLHDSRRLRRTRDLSVGAGARERGGPTRDAMRCRVGTWGRCVAALEEDRSNERHICRRLGRRSGTGRRGQEHLHAHVRVRPDAAARRRRRRRERHEEQKFEKVSRLTELYDRQTAAKCSKACTSLTDPALILARMRMPTNGMRASRLTSYARRHACMHACAHARARARGHIAAARREG